MAVKYEGISFMEQAAGISKQITLAQWLTEAQNGEK